MAGTVPTLLSDLTKSEHFQRAMTLHFDIGAETIRKCIQKDIDSKHINLSQHITNNTKILEKLYYTDKIIKDIQWHILKYDQNLTSMDISLLTIILLNTVALSSSEEQNIIKLRFLRNGMCHYRKAGIENNAVFNSTSYLILNIAKGISNEFSNLVKSSINELDKRKLVLKCSTRQLVLMESEDIMVKLIDNKDGSKHDLDWIRFGLTKWVHQIAKGIEIGKLLHAVGEKKIINSDEILKIQREHDCEEQAHMLVLQLIDANKDVILRFCTLLRLHKPLICDLVENKASGGKDTEKALRDVEISKIRNILTETVQQEHGQYVTSEDIHLLVEKKLGWEVTFNIVQECLYKVFSIDRLKDTDTRFNGITLKERSATEDETASTEDPDCNLDPLSCEGLADYIEKEWEKKLLERDVGQMMKDAVIKESLSSQIFTKMTENELKSVFSEYVPNYNFGKKKFLINLQKRFISNKTTGEIGNQTLRQFDTLGENVLYSKCNISPSAGNLLVPVHHFVRTHEKKIYIDTLVKDVLRFADACINVKQNGTIHFGIHPKGERLAEIVGIKNDVKVDCAYVDDQLGKGIALCFQEKHIHTIKRCIRPVQRVSVDKNSYVLEVDIVPFSSHINNEMFEMSFPPKGIQRNVFFVYESTEILPIESNQQEILDKYRSNFDDRFNLEQISLKTKTSHSSLAKTLVEGLTFGHDYITDELIPVICIGKISGCREDCHVRKQISLMDTAFLSSRAVFDFDFSVELRHTIEGENSSFRVRTADDYKKVLTENENMMDESLWVYCNGNDELKIDPLGTQEWYNERLKHVREAVERVREKIPTTRALVLFFIFQRLEKNEPLFEIARDCILHKFKDECLVISDREENIKSLKTDLTGFGNSIVPYFHTGLTWDRIAELVHTVCRANPDVEYKLPHSGGYIVEMTLKEKNELRFHDIEILSGAQCQSEYDKMDKSAVIEKHKEEEKQFYKGNRVSWWNFFFQDNVGERDHFRKHRNKIDSILIKNKGDSLVETHGISHRPGAGGSTLAMNLLWHYSQFENNGGPSNSFRCCVVRSISEETIRELEIFRDFKDTAPKPFILVIDNQPEEDFNNLKMILKKQAYKTSLPEQLFCLLIKVNRVGMNQESTGKGTILEHELSKKESVWFRGKYEHLEKEKIDVDTLIAFNVMRNSFDQQFIDQTVQKFMTDVTTNEKELLKYLSLINSFESGEAIPVSVFDLMMNSKEANPDNLKVGENTFVPYGIARTMNQRKAMQPIPRLSWDTQTTPAFQLLTTKRKKKNDRFELKGIRIISQPLARSILGYITQLEKVSLNDAVCSLLNFVSEHVDKKNEINEMKYFVGVVNSLFKTRRLVEGDNEEATKKRKFSDLVLELDQTREDETDEKAHYRVVTMMKQCFNTTKDAFVGQQLARFYKHIKDFEEAEKAIKESLKIMPQSSYLLDTYGQVNKSKMETLIDTSVELEPKISNPVANEIISIAFTAISKFKEGQEYACRESEDDINQSCYVMEVETLLSLLEKCERFQCFVDHKCLLRYLNDGSSDLNVPEPFHQLCSGSPVHKHAETSLRAAEEMNYQVKRRLYTVYTASNEALLLKLRERFERFYGQLLERSKFNFFYGVGLKSLMIANEKDPIILKQRYDEATQHLRTKTLKQVDYKDLLVYVGYMVICLSSLETDTPSCQYDMLLKYCSNLADSQKQSKGRPYIEAFLYHAMFHWPTQNRTKFKLCQPQSYKNYLRVWNTAYEQNFELNKTKQLKKPKNYFALGNGDAGHDIIDLESLQKQWRKVKKESEGRTRQLVMKDNFLKDPCLARLEGHLDFEGNTITYKFPYESGTHEFKIRTEYNCREFSNRKVSFVLGFTWRSLIAYEVEQFGNAHVSDTGTLSTLYEGETKENTEQSIGMGSSNKATLGNAHVSDTGTLFTLHEGETKENTEQSIVMGSSNKATLERLPEADIESTVRGGDQKAQSSAQASVIEEHEDVKTDTESTECEAIQQQKLKKREQKAQEKVLSKGQLKAKQKREQQLKKKSDKAGSTCVGAAGTD